MILVDSDLTVARYFSQNTSFLRRKGGTFASNETRRLNGIPNTRNIQFRIQSDTGITFAEKQFAATSEY